MSPLLSGFEGQRQCQRSVVSAYWEKRRHILACFTWPFYTKECVLLQRVENRSLFTFYINHWFIQHVRGATLSKMFEVYTQASLLKRRENVEWRSKFFYGVCSIQHQMRNFPSQVHSQKKMCGPFCSSKSQPFAKLRWTKDFKVRGQMDKRMFSKVDVSWKVQAVGQSFKHSMK